MIHLRARFPKWLGWLTTKLLSDPLALDPFVSAQGINEFLSHRIHGAAIYGNMDLINIPPMFAYIYISYMDPMGIHPLILPSMTIVYADIPLEDPGIPGWTIRAQAIAIGTNVQPALECPISVDSSAEDDPWQQMC